MKEFKDDKEKIEFLIPIIARYRIFIAHYIGITKTQLIGILSRRLNKSEEDCHLKAIKTLDDCVEMIQALKMFKWELTGSKRLPEKVNPRQYALEVKNKI